MIKAPKTAILKSFLIFEAGLMFLKDILTSLICVHFSLSSGLFLVIPKNIIIDLQIKKLEYTLASEVNFLLFF